MKKILNLLSLFMCLTVIAGFFNYKTKVTLVNVIADMFGMLEFVASRVLYHKQFTYELKHKLIAMPKSLYNEDGILIDAIARELQLRLNESGVPCRIVVDPNLSGKKAQWESSDFTGDITYIALSWISTVTLYFKCSAAIIYKEIKSKADVAIYQGESFGWVSDIHQHYKYFKRILDTESIPTDEVIILFYSPP